MISFIFIFIALLIFVLRARTKNNEPVQDYELENRIAEHTLISMGLIPNRSQRETDPLLMLLSIMVVFTIIYSPIIGIILIPVSIFAYNAIGKTRTNKGSETRRKEALLRAKPFLSPYSDIWRKLTLSNKYCSLKLGMDGTTIVGVEKRTDPSAPYRTFKITNTQIFDKVELWNLFCINFSHYKSYDGLLGDCYRYHASIYEDIITPKQKIDKKTELLTEKVDINNASEAEITALPGISIVIAKKIIKKREEIGGFKNVDDILSFLKLRPNITEQLRRRICVNKMQGTLKITRSKERKIDL